MDIELVKISSRGQFVLPLSMRKKNKIEEGEKLMIIDEDGTIVIKPLKKMNEDIEDEIYMMKRAARGWKEIREGKSRKMKKADFLKELSSW